MAGKECCLKAALGSDLLREISILARMPANPSLPRLIGVIDAGEGKVDRFAAPYIDGESLSRKHEATSEEKDAWKEQIKEAVSILHSNGIIWGDVKPGNVMIEKETGCAVLIHFGGGHNPKWVDPHLQEAKEGDLQGLGRMLKYIDGIKTQS